MGKPRERRAEAENASAMTIEQSVMLELSASLVGENRIAFAENFSAAVVAAYWQILNNGTPLPRSLARSRGACHAVLTAEMYSSASAFALGMLSMSRAQAAYTIGTLYTGLLPDSFRAQYGIFYTPPQLVECLMLMAEEAGVDWRTARILDPACGGGAFLTAAIERMAHALSGVEPAIVLQSITARLKGFDIDPFGAWLAQVMVAISLQPLTCQVGRGVAGFVDTRDSLEPRPNEAGRFDLVIGNPPYGRITLPPARRQRFARSVYGHANLYGVFTDAALHWAKPGGVIGYVTPTSMLSGLYYKALRALLAVEAPPLAVNFVSERDGVFADVLQETMLATYRKGGPCVPGKVGFIQVAGDNKTVSRGAGSFTLPVTPHSPWLLPRSTGEAALTRRLRAMPHRMRDYGYGVSTGPLVWNRFKDQFRTEPAANTFPVIWAESVTSDGRFVWRSEKRNHAPWFAARRPKDDWLIITQPCVLLQRTTAKEQARRLIAAELPESFIRHNCGVTIENHLNMVRAISPNPRVTGAVIAALLNSPTVDAAFRCLNGSVAVSAFELEELPLPSPAVMVKIGRLVAARTPKAKVEAAIATAYGRGNAATAS
jgi:adenine-specific DNA-methyltransferase